RPPPAQPLPRAPPLALAPGMDPGLRPAPIPTLSAPSAGVTRALADLFLVTKRKATVLIVLDVSGSMQGEKIATATAATASFLGRLHPDDIVGLQTFSGSVKFLQPPRPVAEVVEGLAKTVTGLIADGG